ncbi:MAG: YggT family protein [Chloroflexota bacterium]|nr:YggT family protein [Chloroflexota bacterium]
MIQIIKSFIIIITDVLSLAIFLRALVSFLPIQTPNNFIIVLIYQVSEPVLSLIRPIIPRTGMIDITPMVAIIVLQVIQSIIFRIG